MPPRSKAQNRLMQAVAHDPKVAKKTGIPQKVGKEFSDSIHGKKLGKLPEKVKKHKRARGRG